MQRKLTSIIVFTICQAILSDIYFGYAAADIIIEYAVPVTSLTRSAWLDKNIPSRAGDRVREAINRMAYYMWRSSYQNSAPRVPTYTAEGVGEVYVSGDVMCTEGVTEVEGAVPIGGTVSFGGPVRASGTVTIAGRCAPAGSRSSPLKIPTPMTPLPPAPRAPFMEVPSTPASVPKASTIEFLPLVEPTYLPPVTTTTVDALPTVTLPPVIIPAYVVPTYVLPEVVIPSAQVYEIGKGYGDIVVTGNDIVVSGATFVDGVIPALGEVTFSGYVPAKGTVTICSHF